MTRLCNVPGLISTLNCAHFWYGKRKTTVHSNTVVFINAKKASTIYELVTAKVLQGRYAAKYPLLEYLMQQGVAKYWHGVESGDSWK